MKPYIAQIKSNVQLMLRDRSVLFFSYMFPAVFFFVFAQAFHAENDPATMAGVISRVLVLGVLGSGLFGAGMRAVSDRETNVLRRFKVAPTNAGPIIVGSMVSGWLAYMPTLALFMLLGKVVYHASITTDLLSLTLFVSIGLITFRAIGMIIAALVNSAQEASILIQILYLPMLFLSGATFPLSMMPMWVQTIAHFLPATYFFDGMQNILLGGQNLVQNWEEVVGLIVAGAVALFVGVKLFRWEKEEKIAGKAKLWIVAVLAPFVVMGAYEARTHEQVNASKILDHQASRRERVLFQNVRVFVGNGNVVSNGAVLIDQGKIAEVFPTPPSDTAGLRAEVVDLAGKTMTPGFIDMHVHIGSPGGVYKDTTKYMEPNANLRRMAAYLYSGITAVRSTGDWLNQTQELKKTIATDRYSTAELFGCGPLFTAKGGHPEELIKAFPEAIRAQAEQQFLRQPKTEEEARAQVDELKKAGVDSIKAVLESGNEVWGTFNRLDGGIYKAIVDEAHKDGLPMVTHTGSVKDVNAAIEAGSDSIEHGAMMEDIPADVFVRMKAKNIAYDPTLSVYEAMAQVGAGKTELLDNSLLQAVGPKELLTDTREWVQKAKHEHDLAYYQPLLDRLNKNLMTAYQAGVLLITGSDAGNELVIHGPTVQQEMKLWVKAGVPPAVALIAATHNGSVVLRADKRMGLIEPGYEATFLLLDGDPVQDINNTDHISRVYFKGERVDRNDLFDQFK